MNLPELGALLADNRAKKFDPAQVVFAIQGERSCRCGRRADDPRTCGRAREAEQGGSEVAIWAAFDGGDGGGGGSGLEITILKGFDV